MAQFTASGAADLYHNNSKKLATTSGGIDVTGSVTCDGLVSDGQMKVTLNDDPQLIIKDGNSTGDTVRSAIAFTDSADATQGRVGYITDSTDNLYIYNNRAAEIRFGTSNTDRVIIDANGHLHPNSSNNFDLGTSSLQWRNGYFDGTVNCDGLTSEGTITVATGDGRLDLKDSNTSGISAQNYVRGLDTNNTQQWYVGSSAGNSTVALMNDMAGQLHFGRGGVVNCYLDNSGHLLPNGNNAYDLGNASNRWRNVYTNDLNLSNEGGANDVDGTWGSWTIQEGEDDLFLLNRRNGKKYKFNLSEVN